MITRPTPAPLPRASSDEAPAPEDSFASPSPAADTAPQPNGIRLAFSVKEAAQMLGVSEKTVRRLINRGLLRSSRAIRHLLIPRKAIERFLDETSM